MSLQEVEFKRKLKNDICEYSKKLYEVYLKYPFQEKYEYLLFYNDNKKLYDEIVKIIKNNLNNKKYDYIIKNGEVIELSEDKIKVCKFNKYIHDILSKERKGSILPKYIYYYNSFSDIKLEIKNNNFICSYVLGSYKNGLERFLINEPTLLSHVNIIEHMINANEQDKQFYVFILTREKLSLEEIEKQNINVHDKLFQILTKFYDNIIKMSNSRIVNNYITHFRSIKNVKDIIF